MYSKRHIRNTRQAADGKSIYGQPLTQRRLDALKLGGANGLEIDRDCGLAIDTDELFSVLLDVVALVVHEVDEVVAGTLSDVAQCV